MIVIKQNHDKNDNTNNINNKNNNNDIKNDNNKTPLILLNNLSENLETEDQEDYFNLDH